MTRARSAGVKPSPANATRSHASPAGGQTSPRAGSVHASASATAIDAIAGPFSDRRSRAPQPDDTFHEASAPDTRRVPRCSRSRRPCARALRPGGTPRLRGTARPVRGPIASRSASSAPRGSLSASRRKRPSSKAESAARGSCGKVRRRRSNARAASYGRPSARARWASSKSSFAVSSWRAAAPLTVAGAGAAWAGGEGGSMAATGAAGGNGAGGATAPGEAWARCRAIGSGPLLACRQAARLAADPTGHGRDFDHPPIDLHR